MIRLLQRVRGANTASTDEDMGNTSLYYAASTDEDTGNTSLHYASKKGWTFIAKQLMKHHFKPTVSNKDDQIPLELAILNNHNKCASFLVRSMEPTRYFTGTSVINMQ